MNNLGSLQNVFLMSSAIVAYLRFKLSKSSSFPIIIGLNENQQLKNHCRGMKSWRSSRGTHCDHYWKVGERFTALIFVFFTLYKSNVNFQWVVQISSSTFSGLRAEDSCKVPVLQYKLLPSQILRMNTCSTLYIIQLLWHPYNYNSENPRS